jgi:tRNA pseudouridine38-40 synthase
MHTLQRNIALLIEYDGTRYSGWQRQKNAPSIQAALEEALAKVVQEQVTLYGAGRTDAGVHALGQVANLKTSSRLAPHSIQKGCNSCLAPDIRIVEACEAQAKFHARHDAILRHYRYQIVNRSTAPAVLRHYYTHVPYQLDMGRMEEAARILRGRHNFAAFRSALCTARRTALTLEKLEIQRHESVVTVALACRSFLHNMARIIVGALIAVGRKKIGLEAVERMLTTQKRHPLVLTVPPHGLILIGVDYPPGKVSFANDRASQTD